MAQNVTQYCHVCKSQTTSGPPVVSRSQCTSEENRSKSKVSTFKSPRTQKLKRMAYKNKKRTLHALEVFARVCVKRLNEDSCEQNLVVWSLLGPSFKLCQPLVTKDAESTIFNLTMESYKPAVGLRTAKNKRIMLAEQRANSSAISQVK